MKKLKVFFNASTISLLIFWGVQMLLYISKYFFTNVCEGDSDSNNVMYELLILSIITFGYLGWFVSIQNSPSFVDTALLLPLHKKDVCTE